MNMKTLIIGVVLSLVAATTVLGAIPETQYETVLNLSIGEHKTWRPFGNTPADRFEQTNAKVADISKNGQGDIIITGKDTGYTVITAISGNQRKKALVKSVKPGGEEKLEIVALSMSVPQQFYFEYYNSSDKIPRFVARDGDVWSHGYAVWKIDNPPIDVLVDHINPATGYVYILLHPGVLWTFLGGCGSPQELYGEWFDPREGYSDYAIAHLPGGMISFYEDTSEFGLKRIPIRKETVAGTECYVYEMSFLDDKRTYWVDITNGLTLKSDSFEIIVYSQQVPQWNNQMRPPDYSTVEDISGDLGNDPPARRPYVNPNK